MNKKEIICNKHYDIISTAEEIITLIETKNKIPKGKIKTLAKKIISLTSEALEDGQNMENRLIEYYTAILKLGFKRSENI